MNRVAISICIPAYKRLAFVERLLQSIAIQTFKDFEVIITDDSPDDSVAAFCANLQADFPLHHFKNPAPLGTPENWNAAIRQAKGAWIKLMHDDDWFTDENSLAKFYELSQKTSADFIFSGSLRINSGKQFGQQQLSRHGKKLLQEDPANLFQENIIGPPSVIMHRNDQQIWYDSRLKWLVDVDFYIRAIKHFKSFAFTTDPLISVGFSSEQVTVQVFHDKAVVIPETLLMLSKLDRRILNRLGNYDFAWRLMRNYNIRSFDELKELKPADDTVSVPEQFSGIIGWQRNIPQRILRIGVFSKLLMFMNYLVRKKQY